MWQPRRWEFTRRDKDGVLFFGSGHAKLPERDIVYWLAGFFLSRPRVRFTGSSFNEQIYHLKEGSYPNVIPWTGQRRLLAELRGPWRFKEEPVKCAYALRLHHLPQ